MKSLIKSKPLVLFILSTAIMFIAISVNASNISNTVSDAEHKQIIQQYIDRIRILQTEILYTNESNLEDSSTNKATLSNRITLINDEIEDLRKEISNYVDAVPSISSQNRDVALAFSALTFIKNELYQLSLLTQATSAVDKNLLLGDFYLFNRLATDTLNILEDLIARE